MNGMFHSLRSYNYRLWAGGALVSYSSCAIQRALQNSATPAPLAERSWVQLYQ